MTTARKNLIDPVCTPYYHCMARCVRQAFLCGKDSFSGKDCEHRRLWGEDRIQQLSSIFALEVCAYAVMSNHYHIVLYINRKQARSWSTNEILTRWSSLFSGPMLVQRFLSGEQLREADKLRVDEFAEEYRCRLMDIGWFMRCLNEHLARKANKEDNCKGRFWEGRYKSQALLDDAALLTCMAYVDLNPVRAKMAKSPETSEYTSISKRTKYYSAPSGKKQPAKLKPFKEPGQNPDHALPYALSSYFELVDWSGGIVRQGKRGCLNDNIPSILKFFDIPPDEWFKTMQWNNRFYRAVGTLASLKSYAEKMGKSWIHGQSTSALLFAG